METGEREKRGDAWFITVAFKIVSKLSRVVCNVARTFQNNKPLGGPGIEPQAAKYSNLKARDSGGNDGLREAINSYLLNVQEKINKQGGQCFYLYFYILLDCCFDVTLLAYLVAIY